MSKPTTREVNEGLRRKYEGEDGNGEEWVLIFEARDGAGYNGRGGSCDLVAINTWPSRGLEVVGHEVKVSRSDFMKELEDPEKSQAFMRFCDKWWLVVPKPWRSVVKETGEVPVGWGLLEVDVEGGRTRQVVAPKRLDREVLPWSLVVAWMAGVDRASKRRLKRDIASMRDGIRAELLDEFEATVSSRVESRVRRMEEARARDLEMFEEMTALLRKHCVGSHTLRELDGWLTLFSGFGGGRRGADIIRLAASELQRAVEILDEMSEGRDE